MSEPIGTPPKRQRGDQVTVWIKAFSGPAISAMLVACVLLTSNWVPFIGKLDVWTAVTEETRARGVTVVAIILAALVGVVLWVAHVGRPSRAEIQLPGGASAKIEQGEAAE